MIMKRVTFVLLLALAASPGAFGQPADVTTIVVPFPGGGIVNLLARAVGDETKQPYIIENKPGADGMIGAKAVAKSKPDGKTWLFADSTTVMVNALLYPVDPAFSTDKDLRPVHALANQQLVLIVKKDFPAGTAKDFIDLSRKREVTYASGGIGSSGHLAMSYLNGVVGGGLHFRHMPYRGGSQAIESLVSGAMESGFVILPLALPSIREGKVTALAVSGAKRSPQLPAVPTMIESGYPRFVVENPYFAWLPSGVPDETVRKVDQMLTSALSDPAVSMHIRAIGLEPMPMGEADARKWVMVNRDIWKKVIRDNKIKPQ
jgi:tripartite-type tricarboxylate transporter receptor subunit TctC